MKLNKEFVVKKNEFEYNDKKNIAYFYLVLDKKQGEVIRGPKVLDKNNFIGFKKTNKNVFVKGGFGYVKIKHNLNFEDWFKIFLKKERKIIKQMSVQNIRLVKAD